MTCCSRLVYLLTGTPDELEKIVTNTRHYDHVPADKFSKVYAGALGLETALAGGLVFASLACPILWAAAFPIALDVIIRVDDIKHGKKYTLVDGEKPRYVSLPVGIAGTVKDWYNRRFG